MNISEVKTIINDNYPEPVLKHWQPTAWDMAHHYNTPRRLKKLETVREKEDFKLKTAYDREVTKRKDVLAAVDMIGAYPAEISSLFFRSFKVSIDGIKQRRDERLQCEEEFLDKYGKLIYETTYYLDEICYKTGYRCGWNSWRTIRQTTEVDVSEEEWKKFAEAPTNHVWNSDTHKYESPYSAIADWKSLVADYKQMKTARGNDQTLDIGLENALMISIQQSAETLRNIAADISACFEGAVPEKCETSPSWGVGGRFDGVISGHTAKTNQLKKISFCSFEAGGHNIQRWHLRYKITELKH